MADSATEAFMALIVQMLENPPDENAPAPLANHFKNAVGVAVPFLVLSFVAVGLRLHARLHIVREAGWDDAFVVIAAVLNLIAQIAFLGGMKSGGFGRHIIKLLGSPLTKAMQWYYVANAAYVTTTACIKLSLLCQYLRLFHKGRRRTVTLIVLITVALWGAIFSFMAWFPCFPVSGFWNKILVPGAGQKPIKCYGFGRPPAEAKNTLVAFAISNMCLDLIVFIIPLTEFFRSGLSRKQVLTMTGLFGVGIIVVLMSILRLWSGLKYNNNDLLIYDYTYWFPELLIYSCLEVDFAIICASIPIFWPSVMAAWDQIYVTKEVIVTVENHGRGRADDLEMAETASRKSAGSTEGLVKEVGPIVDDLPAPGIPSLEHKVRTSWGGTALKKL